MKVVLVGSEGDCGKNRYRPYLEPAARQGQIELFLIDRSRPVVSEPHRNIVPLGIQEDFDQVQDLTHVDLVIIAIPDKLHIPAALQWKGRARDVVIEKPLADSLRSAAQLVAALDGS